MTAGSSVELARGGGVLTTREFWEQHRDAVELLARIEIDISAMERAGDDMEDFRAYVTGWYEAVFAYTQGFKPGSNTNVAMLRNDSAAMLRSLGLLIEKVGVSTGGSPTHRASLLQCIEQATAIIDSELSGWDPAEKEYLFRILESARAALKESAILGSFDLRSTINELIGAMTAIALDIRIADGPSSSRYEAFMAWVGRTSTVLRGIVYDAAALAAIAEAAVDVTKQVTGG